MKSNRFALFVVASTIALTGAAPSYGLDVFRIKSFFDTNGDGALTRSEMRERVDFAHRTADTNKDGFVTWPEAEKALWDVGSRISISKRRGNKLIYGKMQPRFGRADIDKNGGLTKREMLDAVSLRFNKYDKNKDGRVTMWEVVRG